MRDEPESFVPLPDGGAIPVVSLIARDGIAAAFAELERLLPTVPTESLEPFKEVVDALGRAGKFIVANADGGVAPRAGECRVFLEPGEGLLDLLAALRAGEFDFERVGRRHGVFTSVVGE